MTAAFSILALRKILKTRSIGQKLLYYPSLVSTMDTAREEARHGAEEGTVIIAEEQTGGRGRLRRSWLSPEGNIALSIILRPENTALPYLIMVASLAAAHSIESAAGVKTQIKWPNDILIHHKKVCGILVENEFRGNKLEFSIIGIGINTALNVAGYGEIVDTAVSLKAGFDDDLRIKIIQLLLSGFETLYLKLPDGQFIYGAWRKRLITLGKIVKATCDNEIIEGVAEDVDESGALVIRDNDGRVCKVVAGDVTLREK
jgi:BirA family transcriptional regulator, biotin operon repressor / biotin---[acetyl-CoA-carboxylase] ligase